LQLQPAHGGSYPGLETIGKLAAVLEGEPADSFKLPKRRVRRK
jgi:hypothetical protein